MSRKTTNKEKATKIEQMISSYESGKTLQAVGQEFGGISRERVRQIFDKAGFKRRKQTTSDKSVKSRQVLAMKRRKDLPRKKLEKTIRMNVRKLSLFQLINQT